MASQRRRDTNCEIALRQRLHALGLRFRVDFALPAIKRRRADIVFTRVHLAVFVDGCFWHGCPEHHTWPKSNAAWWRTKLERNVSRDRETDRVLKNNGWVVIRIWEHEKVDVAAEVVQAALSELA